ncbi:MAG: hypothetical protein AAF226_15045, partial [Verrucomicrobiota bacterium]
MKKPLLFVSLTIFLTLWTQAYEYDLPLEDAVQKVIEFQEQYKSAEPNSYEYFEALFGMYFVYYDNRVTDRTNPSLEDKSIDSDPFATDQEEIVYPAGVDIDLIWKNGSLISFWDRMPTEAELRAMAKSKKLSAKPPKFLIDKSRDVMNS